MRMAGYCSQAAESELRQSILPHTVRDLPSLPAGLVLPAEIAACAELESTGWLAALQAPISRHATGAAIQQPGGQ
jgi:hypothetical protein